MAVQFSLDQLVDFESKNYQQSVEYLQGGADHIKEFEDVLLKLYSILRHPPGDVDSDDVLAFHLVLAQFAVAHREISMAYLCLMRGYLADALGHMRKSVEITGMAYRISRHRDLAKVWFMKDPNEPQAFEMFKANFKTKDIFPNRRSHSDHNPIMISLYKKYEFASKAIHGSMFGVGRYLDYSDDNPDVLVMTNFFDVPSGPSFLMYYSGLLETEWDILEMAEQSCTQYLSPNIAQYRELKQEMAARHVAFRARCAPIINEYMKTIGPSGSS